MFLGVDGGLLVQPGPKHTDVGYQVRGLLTFSLFSVYVRFGALPHAEESSFREIGVLLKLPIPVIDVGG